MKKTKIVDWLFFLSLFFLFLLPPTDPDLGWQLRCGEIIWQRKGFCSQNYLTVLLEGYSWTNHHWLYQAIIFPFYKFFGLWGLTVLNTLLMTFAFFFFYFAGKNYRLEKMLAVSLIIFLSYGVFSFGIRSQLWGFFFFNLFFWLLTLTRKKPKLSLSFPFIMLVWSNTHGSFMLGLVLLFFWWLGEIINNKRPLLTTLIFLLSFFLTFLNPFGFKIYEEAWRHFSGVKLERLIAEWVPPAPLVWWVVFLTGLGLFFYFLLIAKREKTVSAFLILPFTLLALKARRHVPFYFSLSFSLFFLLPKTKKIFSFWLRQKLLRDFLMIFTLTTLLFFGIFLRLPKTLQANSSRESFCQNSPVTYPCRAVEFLKRQPEKGNLFNRYEWGGFLIWQLPEYKIFVDGRMPAWTTPSGKSPYTIYLETLQTQPGWQETLKNYKINWTLISPGTFMDLLLKENPANFGWQEVYRDKVSVVYKKT